MSKDKVFHNLSKIEQNKIRKEYKEKCKVDYNYSIRLYILYSILGFFTLLGLIILLYKDIMIGSLILVLSLIFMIIDIYFLYRSNYKFYDFLRKKGYIYDKKKK